MGLQPFYIIKNQLEMSVDKDSPRAESVMK